MTENLPTAAERQGIIAWAGTAFGVEQTKVLSVLKSTCFRTGANEPEATDAEVAALLIVARAHGLNPFLREIHAFKDKYKGIVPIVGIDGWVKLVTNHKEYNGFELVTPPDSEMVPNPDNPNQKVYPWMEAVFYSKGTAQPVRIREYWDEVYVPPRGQSKINGPWQSHGKRMHRHKTYIQGARIAFGFSGIYDEDEAERIIEGQHERIPEPPQQRIGATEHLRTAMTDVNKGVQEGVEGARQAPPEGVALVSFETLYLKIDGALTPAEMTAILTQISAHPDSDERKAVMKRWNARCIELKPADPAEDAAKVKATADNLAAANKTAPKKSKNTNRGPDQATGTQETHEALLNTLAGAATQQDLDESMDYARSFAWTGEQTKERQAAYEKRKAELAAA